MLALHLDMYVQNQGVVNKVLVFLRLPDVNHKI